MLNQQGSKVSYGDLILVPINIHDPVCPSAVRLIRGSDSPVPELKQVIVTFNGNSYMRDTLPEALIAAFGEAPPVEPTPGDGGTETPPDDGGDDGGDGGTTTPPVTGSVADLLAQADQKFDEAEQAFRDGDLAAYQLAIDEARDLVAQAAEAAAQEAEGATTTSTTAASSTTTTVASA